MASLGIFPYSESQGGETIPGAGNKSEKNNPDKIPGCCLECWTSYSPGPEWAGPLVSFMETKSRPSWVYTHKTGSRGSNRYLYIHVLSSSTARAQRWEQPKRPWTDEQINKTQGARTTDYGSGLQSEEIRSHATIRVNPENTLLSEVNQPQKDTYAMIPLT